MADALNAHPDLHDRLLNAVGGLDRFSSNWSWRSHSPKQRAESAILGGVETIGDGIAALTEKGRRRIRSKNGPQRQSVSGWHGRRQALAPPIR